MDGMVARIAGWLVCLPLLIIPCTIKFRSSLLAPADPGGPRKRAIKRLWWWVVKGIFVSFFRHKICRGRIRKNKGIYT